MDGKKSIFCILQPPIEYQLDLEHVDKGRTRRQWELIYYFRNCYSVTNVIIGRSHNCRILNSSSQFCTFLVVFLRQSTKIKRENWDLCNVSDMCPSFQCLCPKARSRPDFIQFQSIEFTFLIASVMSFAAD
ncbi:unnamed protein product [Albugo candida]|uniref:Uncharacterized protein n=1 Tax=Albugo candida TaxID=65357 RepID=A0A024FTP0_9STRA|nr:unnamed protein product [Albugo candida]|eukprot:CCI10416.1 unnamed protein product [Albugo candida]